MAQQSPRRTATILWAAVLVGPTAFLGVALYVVFGLREGAGLGTALPEPALLGVSSAISVITVALSWLWAVRMRVRAPPPGAPAPARPAPYPPGPEADAVTRLIVACALCESGALASVIVFLVTGSLLALASYALSWFALAAHFPGERHWSRLVGTPLGAGAGSNRMIRG
jgi:hypothetical protein